MNFGRFEKNRKEIREALSRGAQLRDLHAQFGIEKSVLWYVLRAFGFEPFTVDEGAVVDLYKKGETEKSVARELNCAPGVVSAVLYKNKVLTRSHPESCRQYELDQAVFDDIVTGEQAYWLGFLAADGCVGSSRETVQVTLASRDKEHLEKLRAFLKTNKPLAHAERRSRYESTKDKVFETASLSVSSSRLKSALIKYGIVPRKSLICKPWLGPMTLRSAYIRGIFDGDGSVTRYLSSRKRAVWSLDFLGTHEVMDFIQNHFLTKGISSRNVRKYKKICKISYSAKVDVLAVLDEMYLGSSVYLDRKYSKYLECRAELAETSIDNSP